MVFIIIFFTIIELPALLVLGLWFLAAAPARRERAGSQTVGGGGGVAYFAHIGGFVFGLLAIRLFANRVQRGLRAGAPPAGVLMGRTPFWPARWRSSCLLVGLTIAGAVEGGINVLGVVVS